MRGRSRSWMNTSNSSPLTFCTFPAAAVTSRAGALQLLRKLAGRTLGISVDCPRATLIPCLELLALSMTVEVKVEA
eukprot:CAMPEP_0119106866 /NCGR_PEP_ID=MMETSP1180-20130426/6613_1 /TAXON_ID=3052 ORGANISM="Chlamydomonas cf sp, Strain CCMP681" /NCGR_SAMPLE_ID=MMETSP1180 /ASSEMBLY_ACC=CAM_ASM_000741 /LENGTH=75 /DNA_ID=CAMNT_0007092265 /DNA_START=803 /DNA_END=1030 /DNA_ORIENTATION=-